MPLSPSPSGPSPRGKWLTHAAGGALLVLAVVVIYWPALHGGLLNDDPDHITRPEWRSLVGLAHLWFDVGITSQYFPLLHSVFWVEYHLWGDALAGYHLANVLEHAASACLLVALARRLGLRGAWLAGALFALHPVAVESVAWISEQKNTLSTLLALAALHVYLGFDADRRPGRYALATGLFVCALLCKSITATLVPIIWVVQWWQRGRLEARRDVLPLLPWLAIGAALGLFTVWYERVYAHAHGASFDLSLAQRTLLAGRAVVFYLQALAWPSDLMFVYPRWVPDAGAPWPYLFPGAVLAGGLLLVGLARRRRGPLAVFLAYLLALGPVLGFLNINWFNFSFVADHFQYLASPAIFVGVAAGLAEARDRISVASLRAALDVLVLLVLAILGGLTWSHAGDFRDAETLYRRTVARNPKAWYVQNDLGKLLLSRPGGVPEAIDHLLAALTLKPDYPQAYVNLGRAFSRVPGRMSDAAQAFESALRLKPEDPSIRELLAQSLAAIPGRRADAVVEYRRVLQLDPTRWQAHAGLAELLAADEATQGEAVAELEAAIKLRPDLGSLYNDLGGILAGMGRGSEAAAAFAQAVARQPDFMPGHFNLASVLVDLPGRLPDAIREFEAALKLAPEDPAIHNNLGLALLRSGRRTEAIAHLRESVRLAPDSAEGHFSLGRALLAPPADEAAALEQFAAAARLRPDWDAARRAVAQLRARLGR
ncbi:MAG TPA: tetratricopeptide repeat protein [Lacunisphaera sp.]|nr:tetratricopeptide repeat protein [Lacunisphaera sp.]